MSEEEIIQDKYEETIFNYLSNNCSEFDDKHIKHLVDLKVEQYKQLKSQLQQKENIIKEARKLVAENCIFSDEWADLGFCIFVPTGNIIYRRLTSKKVKKLLEILDKENK